MMGLARGLSLSEYLLGYCAMAAAVGVGWILLACAGGARRRLADVSRQLEAGEGPWVDEQKQSFVSIAQASRLKDPELLDQLKDRLRRRFDAPWVALLGLTPFPVIIGGAGSVWSRFGPTGAAPLNPLALIVGTSVTLAVAARCLQGRSLVNPLIAQAAERAETWLPKIKADPPKPVEESQDLGKFKAELNERTKQLGFAKDEIAKLKLEVAALKANATQPGGETLDIFGSSNGDYSPPTSADPRVPPAPGASDYDPPPGHD